MSVIWDVLGNACSDDAFRKDLMKRVKYGTLNLGDHQDLFEFFRVQTPYCPTRWGLMEINRIMSHAGNDDGPMNQIAAVWDPAPRQDSALRTVGISCLDEGARSVILAGSVEEARKALSEGPPRVSLTLGQVGELRDLFARQSDGKSVLDWLRNVEFLGWIPSDPTCDPGATYTAAYFHANPLIISALQEVPDLKLYLASEPKDRSDRAAMRAEVLRLLQA